MRQAVFAAVSAAFLFASGCSSVEGQGNDAGNDAGLAHDAGLLDAGGALDAGPDAGPATDAGIDGGGLGDGGQDAGSDAGSDGGADAGSDLDGGPDAGPADCPDGGDLIYVIDDSNVLYSFDPRGIPSVANSFQPIGPLTCPVSTVPVTGWTGPVVAYALSVDRTGSAAVLFTSGEIYKVGVQSLSCSSTTYVVGQNNWLLFKLAFVGAAAGAGDRLMVGGGDVLDSPGGMFGEIDLTNFKIQNIGTLSNVGEYGPDLVGVGPALWGFFPGIATAFVQQIDKTSGAVTGTSLPISGGLGSGLSAWAFAHWDTSFYLFLSTQDTVGATTSTVQTLDAQTGQLSIVLPDNGHVVVAAGVSTCAP